jgi:hypothetical protein
MTITNTYSAESWDKVYTAFSQINFTSYDYDTVKESLLQYLKIYYAENFNDFIESSELIAVLELFAYVAELLAYRVDTMSHENFISTAQRKQSILRLAKLISYNASRNIPARGLVKINTIKTTQPVYDSLGNNLAGLTITWNDPNNTNWREQFFLVMNSVITSNIGQPSKAFQIGDALMQLYSFNNTPNSFINGVVAFSTGTGTNTHSMEAVPIDIDANGPFERAPDLNAQFNLVFSNDGRGDGSDYTGFLMFVKQGSLIRTNYTITEPIANRSIQLNAINVNDTDVWVYRIDPATGAITEVWSKVDALNEQTLYFNTHTLSRKKYEVTTLENDQIELLFGDGSFSDIPIGDFQLWTRVSENQVVTIPATQIANQPMSFSYITKTNNTYQCSLTFSLTSALQNNSPSETIEHIRQAAPSTYYSQNRMVNGQDYNTYMLKDSTILRLNTINRTFAGQPKYITWNDASQAYENIKLFGDDMTLYMDVSADSVETEASSKVLIDSFIEPTLQTNALLNTLTHVLATSAQSNGIVSYPRRKFIEDNRTIYYAIDGTPVNPYGQNLDDNTNSYSNVVPIPDGSLNEKTAIQGALDRHWYGEPLSYVTVNGIQLGVINDPLLVPQDDGKLYAGDLPRTIDGKNTYPPGDTGSGLQKIQNYQYFGLRFNRFLKAFGTGAMSFNTTAPNGIDYYRDRTETITVEMTSDKTTFSIISNLRGKLGSYNLAVGGYWSAQTTGTTPVDFQISYNSSTDTAFEEGDAFVVDVKYSAGWSQTLRLFGPNNYDRVNLNGWWEVLPQSVIRGVNHGTNMFQAGPNDGPTLAQQLSFDANRAPNSWVFLVARTDGPTGEPLFWTIYNRNMRIIAQSNSTKFWYNQTAQILDSVTKKPVFDKIRILRSNLDEQGLPLRTADIYDVVGNVYDADGLLNVNQLEILPTDTISFTQAGNATPDNVLQFESFSPDSYQYGILGADKKTITWLACGQYSIGYDATNPQVDPYFVSYPAVNGVNFYFPTGTFVGQGIGTQITTLVRRRYVPAPVIQGTGDCNVISGLDFMWQHFSPLTNLIDPSVSNIHDAFILTRGYYTAMMNYVNGLSSIEPRPPTPLDLRTSYGYLLENKMLSDTVVLHPGKIKLLFGPLADQRFRAKFKVVKSPTATFSDERIQSEIIGVINTYFDVKNWDFGDTFYATELIGLIHQKLPTQIASVVLVPTYTVNSFGSLFTIDSGFDEILQSAATVNDVEIVSALTPAVIRQIR